MPLFVLKMPIANDGTGDARPDAVWKPTQVVMDLADGLGSVTWLSYHSADALLAGAQPIAGLQHITQLDAAHFAAVSAFNVPAGPYGLGTTQALVFVAKSVLDVDTGQKDAAGQPVMAAYFAAAVPTQIG